MVAVVVAGAAWAQEGAAPADRQADEAAIREAVQGLAAALQAKDAKGVAAFWTEQGEYADEGEETVRGREALEQTFTAMLAGKPELKVEATTGSVRFLGADTAIEEGTITVKATGGPGQVSQYRSFYAREGGKWLIAHLEEWGTRPADPPSLEELAWLVGTWESSSAETRAKVTYEWSETKAFLLSRFELSGVDGAPESGMQVIGVDPVAGSIRAWTFDPDGGFGHAYWTWEAGRWAIESEGTHPDGSVSTALTFLTPAGPDAFTWQLAERTVDDQSLPAAEAIEVSRVKGEQ
jgi:uncharacterized protein (TIGR02246 family)